MMRLFCLALISMLIFVACEDDSPDDMNNPNNSDLGTLNIEISPKFGDVDITLNEPITMADGTAFMLGNLYFYLSDVSISGAATSESLDEIVLIDLKDEELKTYTKQVKAVDYSKIQFGFGVSSDLNHADPGTFEIDHPLSLSYGSNHWSWNNGYIFYKVEGQFDSDSDGELDNVFLYHIGTDDFYNTFELEKSFDVSADGETTLTIEIDFEKIFYPNAQLQQEGAQLINKEEETVSHSTGSAYDIADKFVNNLKLSIE